MLNNHNRLFRKYLSFELKINNFLNYSTLPFENIPKAKGVPIFGTLFDFIKAGGPEQLHNYITKRHEQLGPIFREKLGNEELVFVSDCKSGITVFKNEGQYPQHVIPEPWQLYQKITGRKRGSLFMDGEEWKSTRTVLNRHLLRPEYVGNYMVMLEDVCDDLIQDWSQNIQSHEYIQDLEQTLYRWSVESVFAVLFGLRTNDLSPATQASKNLDLDKFVNSVYGIFKTTTELGAIPPSLAQKFNMKRWKIFEQTMNEALDKGKDYFEAALNDQTPSCFKRSLVYQLIKENQIDRETISKISIDLLLAAVDTTSQSTLWILYILAHNPLIQSQIREEITNCLETNEILNDKISPILNQTRNFQYVNGVIKEALRLYPVAPFLTRRLASDCILNNYLVPSKTMVILSIFKMGRDPNYFSQSEKPIPERWMRKYRLENSNSLIHTPTAYLPWGIGGRSCIGKRIAENMMILLITKLILKYEIKALNTINPIVRMIMVPGSPVRIGMQSIL